MEVLDRYPVPSDDDIEVEVPRSATKPTEEDLRNKPGVILWRKALASGEEWTVQHQYSVSYPANRRLVGQ